MEEKEDKNLVEKVFLKVNSIDKVGLIKKNGS